MLARILAVLKVRPTSSIKRTKKSKGSKTPVLVGDLEKLILRKRDNAMKQAPRDVVFKNHGDVALKDVG